MEWQSEDFRFVMGRCGNCAVFKYWIFTREIVITNSVPFCLKPFKELLPPPFYLPKISFIVRSKFTSELQKNTCIQ